MQNRINTFIHKNRLDTTNTDTLLPRWTKFALVGARAFRPSTYKLTPVLRLSACILALLLCTTILFTQWIAPVDAATFHPLTHTRTTQNIAATAYLTTNSLYPLFQQSLDQQTPGEFTSTLKGLTGQLPKQDQGWASQMAKALLQPSSAITSLQPQANGLNATISISLYSGDPKPSTAHVLVTFQVINASTIQVSAQSLAGGPSLVNGPIQTFTLPFGSLQSINTTPNCGDAALATHLTIAAGSNPTTFTRPSSPATARPATFTIRNYHSQQPLHTSQIAAHFTNAQPIATYIEIPATSLTALGSSIGSMAIGNNLTATNIQPTVQGGNLVVTSDIYGSLLGMSIKLGVATTLIEPLASNGQLVLHVTKTSLKLFSIFTFPENNYNAQIEQALKQQIGSAIPSSLYISNAAIGYNAVVPCAASNSLILTGTTSLG